jgi:hypothetical protein
MRLELKENFFVLFSTLTAGDNMCFLFLHSKHIYVLRSSVLNSCGFLTSPIPTFSLFLHFPLFLW